MSHRVPIRPKVSKLAQKPPKKFLEPKHLAFDAPTKQESAENWLATSQ
jgi:hypothetical protein